VTDAEFIVGNIRALTLRITGREAVELTAETETEAECHQLLSEISEALGLEALFQVERLPYGLRRRHFARGRLDRQRLTRIVQACDAAVGGMDQDRFSDILNLLCGPT
jgi:hypothetical protein